MSLSPEQLWFDLNDLQRKLYSCYSTGHLKKDKFELSVQIFFQDHSVEQ